MTARPPSTWHYGAVARWWAEFNTDGPEIAFYRPFVRAGQPALDVACGTGRLLIPYLREGVDVDGCDVSPDMLGRCQEAAEREGLAPKLYAQAMHELDLPRRYRTIFVCGSFGIGSTRAQDDEALGRMYRHLEPGGTLLLDNQVPYSASKAWGYWTKEGRRVLPEPPAPPGDRRVGSDGTEYELRGRLLELDPLEQTLAAEIRAFMWRGGELVAEEEHVLTTKLFFKNELVLMLEKAGFVDITVQAGYTGVAPTADDDTLVFIGKRPTDDAT